MAFLSDDQQKALHIVAAAFGWDRMSLDKLGLIAWAAFHYYTMRLPQ